nr:MAG TPA: hypothetical protein [Caudoviricetes sp.]
MWDKLDVLNNSYQELSDCLQDLLKYEMIGVVLDGSTIGLVSNMVDNTQFMIDHIDEFEWSDVMKVRQSNYTVIRMINTLLINQYDKIFSHK